MLLLLQKHDVEFMVIGAYALAFHGVPRSTGDTDFFLRNTEIFQNLTANFGHALLKKMTRCLVLLKRNKKLLK